MPLLGCSDLPSCFAVRVKNPTLKKFAVVDIPHLNRILLAFSSS